MPLNTADIGSKHLLPSAELGGLFASVMPDTTRRKHGGNDASNDAHEKTARVARWHYQMILERLAIAGPTGMTCREFMEWFNLHRLPTGAKPKGMNHFSARFTELADQGKIRAAGDKVRREGCGVWILSESTK